MALSHLSPVCSDSWEEPWVSSNQPSGKGPDLSLPSGNARQAVLAAPHPGRPSPQPDAGGSGDWEQEHVHPPTWGTPLLGTPAKETIQQEKHACTANPRSSSEQRGLEQPRGAGKALGWVVKVGRRGPGSVSHLWVPKPHATHPALIDPEAVGQNLQGKDLANRIPSGLSSGRCEEPCSGLRLQLRDAFT